MNKKAFNEDINFVGDQVYSWQEMLETLYELLDKDKKNIVSIPTKKIARILPCYKEFLIGDRSLNAVFDNTKLKECIPNYKQNISLKKGLEMILIYYKEHNFLNGIDYKYDARIDKLIKKENGINFDFIDYLNAHRIKDRVTYSIYRNWGETQLNQLRILFHGIKKIMRLK